MNGSAEKKPGNVGSADQNQQQSWQRGLRAQQRQMSGNQNRDQSIEKSKPNSVAPNISSAPGAIAAARDLAKYAPNLPMAAAKSATKFVLGLLKQIDLVNDWPFFFILLPFAALKDLFDIAFAALVPIGVAISFLGSICIALLTVLVFLLIGAGFKSFTMKKQATRMLSRISLITGGTVVEFIPGLDWFPFEIGMALMAYLLILLERVQDSSK